MNYMNPNFYPNYQYGGNNQFLQNQPTQTIQPSLINNQPQINTINGKIVDSVDMVKATEVPIGGYGVFPKADLNEIYVKTWNNNGTTNVVTFKPFIQQEEIKETTSQNIKNDFNSLLEKISSLEAKLDSFLNQKTVATPAVVVENNEQRKVNINDY